MTLLDGFAAGFGAVNDGIGGAATGDDETPILPKRTPKQKNQLQIYKRKKNEFINEYSYFCLEWPLLVLFQLVLMIYHLQNSQRWSP